MRSRRSAWPSGRSWRDCRGLRRHWQSQPRENLLGEALENPALGRVGQVDDKVLDPDLGVRAHGRGDLLGIADVLLPRPDKRLVFARPPGRVTDHPVGLPAVAEDGIELRSLEDRVVVAAYLRAVLAQHRELVSGR